jgi:hypothetical protein
LSRASGVSSRRPRFDPFRILSLEERTDHLEGYDRFLAERDGRIALASRTLSTREQFFEDLDRKPVEWVGGIDYEGFHEHVVGRRRGELDPHTAWLVAVARANEGEAYGVDLELRRCAARPDYLANADRAYQHLILEECYHTRILQEACRTCGLEVRFKRPRGLLRLFIHLIQVLPERMRFVPVLCGEVCGTVVFRLLRDRTRIFSQQPEVEERLRMLLDTIYVDETMHVAYLRARLGPLAIRAARLFLPLVAAGILREVSQFLELGATRAQLVSQMKQALEIPASAAWMTRDSGRSR